jgi:hypothetical protein
MLAATRRRRLAAWRGRGVGVAGGARQLASGGGLENPRCKPPVLSSPFSLSALHCPLPLSQRSRQSPTSPHSNRLATNDSGGDGAERRRPLDRFVLLRLPLLSAGAPAPGAGGGRLLLGLVVGHGGPAARAPCRGPGARRRNSSVHARRASSARAPGRAPGARRRSSSVHARRASSAHTGARRRPPGPVRPRPAPFPLPTRG